MWPLIASTVALPEESNLLGWRRIAVTNDCRAPGTIGKVTSCRGSSIPDIDSKGLLASLGQ